MGQISILNKNKGCEMSVEKLRTGWLLFYSDLGSVSYRFGAKRHQWCICYNE